MTLLGKVLVFVNLAFSLAVAFFITQSYARRTDWARAYKEANEALSKAGSQRDQYAQQAQDAVAQGKANVATVQAALNKTLQEKGQCDAQINDLQGQIEKHKATLAKAGINGSLTMEEIKRLGERAQKVEQLLADANKRLDDQTKVVEDFRQRAVKAEIDNKSLIARNNELVNVVQEKEQDIVRLKANGGTTATTTQTALTSNPPPSDVSGRVKQYDPTSGLMTITVGSDAGVLKGHTLQVYRLEPNGQYVGVMRVMEVRPNEAVGKMIRKPRVPVQVNDKVASKIS